tara:strand:+ start:797 stop:1321 length:525 start_codon:yes stop_codon:yes gene_type:complete
MKQIFQVFILVFFIFSGFPIISDAQAHSLFNSSEETLGDYRIQIATLPEFPQIGEKSEVLIRVTDNEFNEVDRFTMGMRVFFNEEQVDAVRPQSIDGAHFTTDFVFYDSGNHIFRVDLYDATDDGGILTFTFNISTQSPFGYIFISAIAAGGIIIAGVIAIIFIPKIIKKKPKF